MATYTSNINLKKPAQSDKIRIADFNTNADNIDDAFGAGFGVSSAPSVNAEINSLADGLAIIANGNVHAAISSGQFVYVRGHGTLANGLYVANQNISANATLTSSNLDADTSGGLNALNANIAMKDSAIYHASALEHKYTVPSRSRHLVILGGNGGLPYTWIGFIYANNSGGLSGTEIYKGTNIDDVYYSSAPNVLKIIYTQAQESYLRSICVAGDAMTDYTT